MLNDFFLKAQEYKKKGHFNMAVIELASLFNIDKHSDINPLEYFSFEQRENILEVNKSAIDKILRIFSIGSKWTVDEYILLLTFVLNYRLIKDYYKFYQLELGIEEQVLLLEEEFYSTLKNEKNYKNSYRAASTIIKNRKSELDENFLKDVFLKFNLPL